MKLELKHLAPYLPHGVDMKVVCSFYGYNTMKLCDKSGLSNIGISDVIDEPQDFKPILRPLSDLKEYFKPLFETDEEVKKYLSNELDYGLLFWIDELSKTEYKFMPFVIFDLFCKHHFDVFGLIEKGLAVDLKTLK